MRIGNLVVVVSLAMVLFGTPACRFKPLELGIKDAERTVTVEVGNEFYLTLYFRSHKAIWQVLRADSDVLEIERTNWRDISKYIGDRHRPGFSRFGFKAKKAGKTKVTFAKMSGNPFERSKELKTKQAELTFNFVIEAKPAGR